MITTLGSVLLFGGAFALGVLLMQVYVNWCEYDDDAHSKVGYNPIPDPAPPRPKRVTPMPPRKRKKR